MAVLKNVHINFNTKKIVFENISDQQNHLIESF